MKCPNCENITLSIAERAGIEIDHCPHCRGVWLDRGELDKILERSQPELSPSRYRDDYRHEKGYRKKKSFLEELFD